MPESFVRVTLSIGEASRIRDVLSDAHFDDDAAMLSDVIEDGPHFSFAELGRPDEDVTTPFRLLRAMAAWLGARGWLPRGENRDPGEMH